MSWIFYYLSMYLMTAGIFLSSIWNLKSKQWIRGRQRWLQKINKLPQKKQTRIWFHVASLGEFEQARPVIEWLKKEDAAFEIILTFFSPSGYHQKADYPLAHVFYLPADLPGNAEKWTSCIQPDMAVFVKYDLWPGFLRALQKREIPTLLISAYWLPGKRFHSSTLPLTRSHLKQFDQIFLQHSDHVGYYKEKGFHNLQVAGDSRIDRSLQLEGEAEIRLPSWLKELPAFDIVAGSTWPKDEMILLDVIRQLGLRIIIAPHDVSSDNIRRLRKQITQPVTILSEYRETDTPADILIVDSIGLLNVLYAIGRIAYVGGGFGSGIHNTLEPAAHHKPVIFGPAFNNFPEAIGLQEAHAAWSVTNRETLINVIQNLLTSKAYRDAGERAFNYLVAHRGASETIGHYIMEKIGY